MTHKGQALLGLQAKDFEVRDNGVLQQVELADAGGMPVSVVLVLDTSASVFGENPATGMTALNDALYAGLGLLQGRRERSVVVLFTDGADNSRWLTDQQVLSLAREAESVIYTVATLSESSGTLVFSAGGTSLESRPAIGRLPQYEEVFLKSVTDATGGRLFAARRADLAGAFLKVLAEIRTRYLLRYTRRGVGMEGWHRLDVRVVGRSVEVRARQGYLRPPHPADP